MRPQIDTLTDSIRAPRNAAPMMRLLSLDECSKNYVFS